MKFTHIISAPALALCFALCLSCRTAFTGTVAVKGNEPHTYTAIASENHGHLRIEGPLADEIRRNCQGRKIKAYGEIKAVKGPADSSSIFVESYNCSHD